MRHNIYLLILASFVTAGCRIPLDSNGSRVKDVGEDPNTILMAKVKFDAATESLAISSSEKVNFLSVTPSMETDSSGAVEGKTLSGDVIKDVNLSFRNISVSIQTNLAKDVTCTTQKASLGMLVSSMEVKFVCLQPYKSVTGKDKPEPGNGKQNESSGEQGKISSMTGKGTCACYLKSVVDPISKVLKGSPTEVPALFDAPASGSCDEVRTALLNRTPKPITYSLCKKVENSSQSMPKPTPTPTPTPPSNQTGSSTTMDKTCNCKFDDGKDPKEHNLGKLTFSQCFAKNQTLWPKDKPNRLLSRCNLQ